MNIVSLYILIFFFNFSCLNIIELTDENFHDIVN